jgi:hypothetical protein
MLVGDEVFRRILVRATSRHGFSHGLMRDSRASDVQKRRCDVQKRLCDVQSRPDTSLRRPDTVFRAVRSTSGRLPVEGYHLSSLYHLSNAVWDPP